MSELIKKQTNIASLVLITVIAFCLRFFMLGSQSLWMDEAVIYSLTKMPGIPDVYRAVLSQEGHIGPFFHILNYLFSQLFGYSEWALRIPSALYGTISVIFVYKIAEAIKNKRVALFSSILIALSPVHVWYSQEARMYSLWVMLILITTFLFIKILEKSKLCLWILFTIFAALSLWTFLNSIFIFLAYGLYLVTFLKRYKREFCFYITSMFAAALSYSPGIVALLAKGPVSVGSTRTTTLFDFIYAFYVFNVGTTFGPPLVTIRASLKQLGEINTVWKIVSQYIFLIFPSMILYTGVSLYGIYKAIIKRKDENYTFILIMLFVPSIIIFTITLFSGSIPFNVRYILPILPFYLILLSLALSELSIRKRWVLFCGMVFLSGLSLYNLYFKAEYSKLDFRSAVKYLNETMKDSDNAIIIHEGARSLLQYYDKTDKLNQYHMPELNSFESASSIANGSERIFYVKSIRSQEYDEREISKIETLLTEDFDLIESVNRTLYVEIKIYQQKKQ